MRDIKFRGKANRAYFFKSDGVDEFDGFVFGTPDTRMLNVPGAEKWRKEHLMVDLPSIVAMTRDGWPRSVVVIEDTIGQFTGLQDKNGKDIYEGDIIRFVKGLVKESGRWVDDAEIYAVEYDGAVFYPLCNLSKVTDSIEIIGNIYDNPELLKGGSHASI